MFRLRALRLAQWHLPKRRFFGEIIFETSHGACLPILNKPAGFDHQKLNALYIIMPMVTGMA